MQLASLRSQDQATEKKCQSDWLSPAAQSLPPPSRDINPGLDPGGSVVTGDGP